MAANGPSVLARGDSAARTTWRRRRPTTRGRAPRAGVGATGTPPPGGENAAARRAKPLVECDIMDGALVCKKVEPGRYAVRKLGADDPHGATVQDWFLEGGQTMSCTVTEEGHLVCSRLDPGTYVVSQVSEAEDDRAFKALVRCEAAEDGTLRLVQQNKDE